MKKTDDRIFQKIGCLKIDSNSSALVNIYVQPRSAKTVFTGIHGQAIKLKISSPPVDGKANAQVTEILAKLFNIPKRSVVLKRGKSERSKWFQVLGVDVQQAEKVLSTVVKIEGI